MFRSCTFSLSSFSLSRLLTPSTLIIEQSQHPLSPPSLHYWTSTTTGHKTRKNRVLAHFATCKKGRSSEALKALARLSVEEGRGK
jgi:hypothetical protein